MTCDYRAQDALIEFATRNIVAMITFSFLCCVLIEKTYLLQEKNKTRVTKIERKREGEGEREYVIVKFLRDPPEIRYAVRLMNEGYNMDVMDIFIVCY